MSIFRIDFSDISVSSLIVRIDNYLEAISKGYKVMRAKLKVRFQHKLKRYLVSDMLFQLIENI